MNFDEAVRAHAEWKLKLSNYLRKPDDSLDATKAGVDNACILGQWLYGEGQKFAQLDEYKELIKEHALFHKAVSDIIRRKNKGEDVSQDTVVAANSEFSNRSVAVVSLIMSLKKKVL